MLADPSAHRAGHVSPEVDGRGSRRARTGPQEQVVTTGRVHVLGCDMAELAGDAVTFHRVPHRFRHDDAEARMGSGVIVRVDVHHDVAT